MRRVLPHALASEWGPDFTRGVGVSAFLHAAVVALLLWIASRAPAPPPPLTSYTVELTDPAALGGRLAFGPLDRPLGRPRRIAEAAGGAVAGAPSPGESAAAEAAKAAKAAESRKPVAPARVAEAPKPPESAKPKDPDAPVVPPKPAPAPTSTAEPRATAAPKPIAPPAAARPTTAEPAPVAAAPKPREPEVRLTDQAKPREQPKPVAPPADAEPSQAAKAEARPAATKQAPPATLPAEPPAKATPPTTLATPTTVPTPTTLPEPTASPEPADAREAPAVRPESPGAVTAHPRPGALAPALPTAEGTAKKPAGAAEGVRIVPAKPVAPAPAPGVGTAAKPAPDLQAHADGGVGSGGSAEAPVDDDYAAAAERWRSRMSGGMGGMAGAQSEQGTVGDGTAATGAGGSVVGFEYLSYRQRIFGLIKGNWVNPVRRAGLVAAVRFEIAPDGTVSGVQLLSSSGDKTYDQSVVRAVQRSNPLPPPPERYREDFREVSPLNFLSDEEGGQGTR